MSNRNYLLSIIIPTLNSARFLPILLKSINSQTYKNFEIIIADNGSTDETRSIASKYRAKFVSVPGNPPQVSVQRNIGAQKAKGDYLFFIDHDMEFSSGLLKNFINDLDKSHGEIGVFYIPEVILAKYRLLSRVRTFENSFYNNSVIGAVRIIERKIFLSSKMYDPQISNGPADWDYDIELRKMGNKRGVVRGVIFHHEERLSLMQYIAKKNWYMNGIEKYKRKWRKNSTIYKEVVEKQFSLTYRFFWVFIENGKWKRLIPQMHLYILFICFKSLVGLMYLSGQKKWK